MFFALVMNEFNEEGTSSYLQIVSFVSHSKYVSGHSQKVCHRPPIGGA
jgi:hypothetical protein